MYFLSNNLFTNYTLQEEFPKLYDFKEDLTSVFDSIANLYQIDKFAIQNEHQFEDEFIAKVLEVLGWHTIRQEEKIIQGKLEKPDFLLFATQEDKQNYLKLDKLERRSSNANIAVILESKGYQIPVDNKKIKDNPHFQILRYLSHLKVDFGFLTNGRKWRFYDNSTLSSQKIFYEIDLEAILSQRDVEAFKYFYFIFNAQNFISEKIQTLFIQDAQNKTKIEDDLKSIIYGINGKDSVFEKIGACIYAKRPDVPLEEIYQNTLYFIFRLLFIAYFEDKFEEVLQQHACYSQDLSIHSLLKTIDSNPQSCSGFGKLTFLFSVYDKGEPNFDMPVFNGGLFDPQNAPLLQTPRLFQNIVLKEILENLFFITLENKTFKRDYKTLSITHLGSIYEGILSYYFEIAQENIYYILYTDSKSKTIEGFFDAYDCAKITKAHKNAKITLYQKGELYLKNTSNSRKSTASFYTPQSLTDFLTQKAMCITDENILHYKILDNACGSGHFLVSCLNFITEYVIAHFESFPSLKAIYIEESKAIHQNTAQFIQGYQIDESDILKRILLKRMIYGVDLNPFSVELTKLSLWIDSFIFGTPLSFIEHHIKCGNALVGSSIQEFRAFYQTQSQQDLFLQDFMHSFDTLSLLFEELNELKDTTEQEIKQSKEIYTHRILPKLQNLELALDYFTAHAFFTSKDKAEYPELFTLHFLQELANPDAYPQAKARIKYYAKEYAFLHYQIAFPEVFSQQGFHCIIGNPPWDKTKFSDDDFFPQFISDYRTRINSQKREIVLDLLDKPYIKSLYEAQKAKINTLNAYYKEHYPLNRGSGDGNLFRFFVEANLRLLAPNATLNYVLPSALAFEEGSFALRKHILEHKQLNFFLSFENREGIFPDIDSRYKFALMQIQNTPPAPKHTIQTFFYQTNPDALQDPNLLIPMDMQTIATISPTQLAFPEVRNTQTLEILSTLYQKFDSLSMKWMDFRGELHMTNDKDLFIEQEQTELLPLYEGKMIHQFNASFGSPTYFLSTQEFDERVQNKELYQMKQDLQMNTQAFRDFCDKNKINPIDCIAYDREFIRIGYRSIARDTDERTGIFSLLPTNCGCGNSLYCLLPKNYKIQDERIIPQSLEIEKILFSLAIFNSLVVDFVVRGMVQINFNKTYLQRIPFPQPTAKEIRDSKLYATLARNALALQRYLDKQNHFQALDELFCFAENPKPIQITRFQSAMPFANQSFQIPRTPKAYLKLKAQNDILIAKLYGLSKTQFQTLLSTFKVLHTKQPQYINLLLEIWESVELE